MLCPGCGKEIPRGQSICSECEPATASNTRKAKRRGGLAPWQIGIILGILVFALVGGAVMVVQGQRGTQPPVASWPRFNPGSLEWVDMKFQPIGFDIQVPGAGWTLNQESETLWTFKNQEGASLELYLVSFMVFNDLYRVDNKPIIYEIVADSLVNIRGFSYPARLVKVSYYEGENQFIKEQLHFQRSFWARDGRLQTYVYLVTFTYPANQGETYKPILDKIIGSISLYEYK